MHPILSLHHHPEIFFILFLVQCFYDIYTYPLAIYCFCIFFKTKTFFLNKRYSHWRTSLVVQRTGIRLPVQGTQVWLLVQEGSTCHGATNHMHHNCWAQELQWLKPRTWSLCSAIRDATTVRSPRTATKIRPALGNQRKSALSIEDPMQAKQ